MLHVATRCRDVVVPDEPRDVFEVDGPRRKEIGDDGSPAGMSTEPDRIDARTRSGLADCTVEVLAQGGRPVSGREHEIELLAVVLHGRPTLRKILFIFQPPLTASLEQSDGRSAEKLGAHGSTGLGRSERHPDAIGVGRSSPDEDGAATEVEVLPCEAERLADSSTLHEAQGGGRCEAEATLVEQSLRFGWGDRAALLRCGLGCLDLAGSVCAARPSSTPCSRIWTSKVRTLRARDGEPSSMRSETNVVTCSGRSSRTGTAPSFSSITTTCFR